MELINICKGAFVVRDAVGAVETTSTRLEGSGTMLVTTTIRSKTGGVLFQREDREKLSDKAACDDMETRHYGYLHAVTSVK